MHTRELLDTFAYILVQVEAEELGNTVLVTLTSVKAETFGDIGTV